MNSCIWLDFKKPSGLGLMLGLVANYMSQIELSISLGLKHNGPSKWRYQKKKKVWYEL